MHTKESTSFRFLKNTVIFFLGSILSKVITFFMLPLYTSYINPIDYGYYDLSIAYVTIVTSALFFDIWVTTMRYMYEKKEIKWKWKASQSGIFIYLTSLSLLVLLGLIVNKIFEIKYLSLIIGYAITLSLANMFLYIARGYGNNIIYSISGILNTLIIVVSNIIMIVGLQMDFSSLYIASIFGHLAQCIFIESRVKILKNLFQTKLDLRYIKNMFFYSLPLSINSISYWLLTSFNKVVVQSVLSIEYNGYYAIGNKFGYALSLATNSFTLAWQDLSFSRSANDKSNGLYYSRACSKYLAFLGMGACVLLPFFNVVFDFLVNRSYYVAKATIPLFVIAALLNAYSTFIGNIFYAIKDTKSIFYSMVVSCTINLILCYPLIKIYAINGANISMTISFLVNILIRGQVLYRKIGFRLNYKEIIKYTVLIFMTSIIYSTNMVTINILWMIIMIFYTIHILKSDIIRLFFDIKNRIGLN